MLRKYFAKPRIWEKSMSLVKSQKEKNILAIILCIVMVFEFSPHFVELVRCTIGGI